MKTFNQYLPAFEEKKGGLYFPVKAMVAALASGVLLTGALSYALTYPYQKSRETLENLQHVAAMIAKTNGETDQIISQILAIKNDEKASKYTAGMVDLAVYTLREKLATVKPVDEAQILALADKQAKAYIEAQALIEKSPFKNLPEKQVPLTEEGQAFLAAIKTERPPKYSFQRLAAGAELAWAEYGASRTVLSEAENILAGLNRRIGGTDRRAPRQKDIVAPAGVDFFRDALAAIDAKLNGAEAIAQQKLKAEAEAAKAAEAEKNQSKEEVTNQPAKTATIEPVAVKTTTPNPTPAKTEKTARIAPKQPSSRTPQWERHPPTRSSSSSSSSTSTAPASNVPTW